MTRLTAILVLGGVGVLFSPAAAPAQFVRPFGLTPLPTLPAPSALPGLPSLPSLPSLPWPSALPTLPVPPSLSPLPSLRSLPSLPSLPALSPLSDQLAFIPRFRYTYGSQYTFNSTIGSFSFGQRYTSVTPWPENPFALYAAASLYLYAGGYGQGRAYTTGGANVDSDIALMRQRAIQLAQREASRTSSRSAIAGQADYEKGAKPAPGPAAVPEDVRRVLAAPQPAEIVSGDALNQLTKEIVRIEAKGAKGPSGYVSALLLDDIRFSGSPAADLFTLARQAGSLEFPSAFDEPALAELRAALERDFAAIAEVVQAGKSPDAAKIAKLDTTFQKADTVVEQVIKDLPFEDGAAARRFMNRMAGAIKALKAGAANGLINPKWAAEGLTVADLVKHMMRHKLQFGAAPKGRDEAYMTMHRNLVTYLFVLTQPKK